MARRSRVAISAGGSIVAPEELDVPFLRSLAALLREVAETQDLLVVVGGGRTARRYIDACRELGADEESLDMVGIEATRLNARLLVAALGEGAYQGIPATLPEALEAMEDHAIVVMGGTHPGHTTDAVCAMLAEQSRAGELLNLTNVDGVYTADPRTEPSATRLARIATSELVGIVGGEHTRAGPSTVMDPLAARIVHRARIPTKVLDGRDLEQVARALRGDDFHGTVVVPDDGD